MPMSFARGLETQSKFFFFFEGKREKSVGRESAKKNYLFFPRLFGVVFLFLSSVGEEREGEREREDETFFSLPLFSLSFSFFTRDKWTYNNKKEKNTTSQTVGHPRVSSR